MILIRMVSAILIIGSLHAAAPCVMRHEWGKIVVKNSNGSTVTYKDCKLFPTGSKKWDWRITGTEHTPGIQIADLEDIVAQCSVIILSTGMLEMLQVTPEVLTYLEEQSKEYFVKPTPEAIKLYNDLVKDGKKVGALLHSTC